MLDNLRRSPLDRHLATIDDASASESGSGGVPQAVVFTAEQQAHLDQIVQGRVAQASRTAATAKEQEIGAYLAAQDAEAKRAGMEEIDRLKAEKVDADAKTVAAEAKTATVQAQADATQALLAAGLNPALLTDGLRLIDTGADDLGAEVKALAERLPSLFLPAGQAAPAVGIIPPRTPVGGGGTKTGVEAGRDLYKSRHTTAA